MFKYLDWDSPRRMVERFVFTEYYYLSRCSSCSFKIQTNTLKFIKYKINEIHFDVPYYCLHNNKQYSVFSRYLLVPK